MADQLTELHRAVMSRDIEAVRRLTAAGANPREWLGPLRAEASPLAMAEDRGYGEIAEILRSVPLPEPKGEDPATSGEPLREAVIHGDLARLAAEGEREAIERPRDDQGWLLRVAVDHGRLDVLRFLLDRGLDPDARVSVGENEFTWGMPLYAAVRRRDHTAAKMLLDRGADPNGQVYAGGTPLSEAYGQIDEEMIQMLIRYGGKPNPSMAGLYRRKDLALRFLAEHGDEPLPDDGFSSGPVAEQLLGAAAKGGDPEIVDMALARISWPDGDPRWYGALAAPLGFWNHWYGPWCHLEWDRSSYLACFRKILARIGPPNLAHPFGITILHRIALMGAHVEPEERVQFAESLLDAGARLDLRDEVFASTPLGWACRWGRVELVRLFLDRRADPVEAGAEPWASPNAWARKKGHPGIEGVLSETGAIDRNGSG